MSKVKETTIGQISVEVKAGLIFLWLFVPIICAGIGVIIVISDIIDRVIIKLKGDCE